MELCQLVWTVKTKKVSSLEEIHFFVVAFLTRIEMLKFESFSVFSECVDKFKKKVDDAGKLSPAHSENDERNSYKVIDGEDIQNLAIKEENLKKVYSTNLQKGKYICHYN